MEKPTIQEKLLQRQVKTPSSALFFVLMLIVKVLNLSVKPEFIYRADPKKEESPFILISNHASRNDYLFTAPVCYPKKLNYVVGFNEFFRFPLGLLLRAAQVIPKKNFTPDYHTIKQVLSVAKQGGNICFMPEGMSSITGMAQPVIPGGSKLLKKLKMPVYYTKIAGGYLTYTKHCLDTRKGKVEVIVDKMFTPEELEVMSLEEIEDRMNMLLAHDDYIWNKERQIPYESNGNPAKAIETLLYRCPKCNEVYTMKTTNDTIYCEHCGNTIKIDDMYNLTPLEGSVSPELITDWTIMEREEARKMVEKEGFSYSEHVKIGFLPKYKFLTGDDTSNICGDGILTLDKDGLHFRGTAEGNEFNFDLTTEMVPTYGMCTDISRFYTFVDGNFVEFYPDNNDVLLWDHLTEEMHRANGGKWQNTDYRHYN